MYEPIRVRTSERLLHHAFQLVLHTSLAFLRWLWRCDHIIRWVTLPFLIFGIELGAQRLGLRGAHRPAAITSLELLIVLFVGIATVFGGPKKR